MKKKSGIKKMLSKGIALFLVFLLTFTNVDYDWVTYAKTARSSADDELTEEEFESSSSITAIEALDESIAHQKLAVGMQFDDIEFPDKLTVTVTTTSQVLVNKSKEEEASSESSSAASSEEEAATDDSSEEGSEASSEGSSDAGNEASSEDSSDEGNEASSEGSSDAGSAASSESSSDAGNAASTESSVDAASQGSGSEPDNQNTEPAQDPNSQSGDGNNNDGSQNPDNPAPQDPEPQNSEPAPAQDPEPAPDNGSGGDGLSSRLMNTLFPSITVHAADPDDDDNDNNDDDDDDEDTNVPDETPVVETEYKTITEDSQEVIEGITWELDTENSSAEEFSTEQVGDVFIYKPVLPEDKDVQADLPTITVEIIPVEEKEFTAKQTFGDIKVSIQADPGVFPIGAYAMFRQITGSELAGITEEACDAYAQEHEPDRNGDVTGVESVCVFDITVYDKDGNEIQPDNSKGEVKVVISGGEIDNSDDQTMFRVEDSGDITFLDTEVDSSKGSLSAVADHFSYYGASYKPKPSSGGSGITIDKTYKDADTLARMTMSTNKEGTVIPSRRDGTVYTFSNGMSTVGIESGIILDTSGSTSGSNDSQLASIMDYSYGGHTAVLEFEMVSDGDLLNFNYVFASGEFNQQPRYNDVFGLFISVNNGSWQNIAKITRNNGTEVAANINNLRAGLSGTEMKNGTSTTLTGSHSLFTATNIGSGISTNGVSNVFNAQLPVHYGDKVKVKFAIADVSDTAVDSYVFIEAGSLNFQGPNMSLVYLDEDGNQIGDMVSVEEGTVVTIKNAAAKSGYNFLGWNTNIDGSGQYYQPGYSFALVEHMTLFAIYAPIKNTVEVTLDRDGAKWGGRTVTLVGTDLKGKKRTYTLAAKSGSTGVYRASDVINGTYDIYVDGKKSDKSVTVNAKNDSVTLKETVYYATINVTTRVNGSPSSAPGPVVLRQNGKAILTMTGTDGVYTNDVLVSAGNYQIYVNAENTNITIGPSDNTKVIDYYRVKVTIKDDEPWTNAYVQLKNSSGTLVAALEYDSALSSGNSSVYTRILRESTNELTIHVGDTNTNQTVKACEGNNEKELTFYKATIKVLGPNLPRMEVSMNNTVDEIAYTASGAAPTWIYTARHVYMRSTLDGSELDYEVLITGTADTEPIIINSNNKNLELPFRKAEFYNYRNNNGNYEAFLCNTFIVRTGKAMPSYGSVLLRGYSFNYWSKNQWQPGVENTNPRYDFANIVNDNIVLYAQFDTPTIKINDIVQTDAAGVIGNSVSYYRMANATISGFDKGEDAIKYLILESSNTESMIILDNSGVNVTSAGTVTKSGSKTTISPATSVSIVFGSTSNKVGISMAAAQAFLRDKVVVKPVPGTTHTMEVTAKDGSGEYVAASITSSSGFKTTDIASKSVLSSSSSGVTLSSGAYLVNSNITISNSNGNPGITISNNATVYLYVEKNCTLTVYGGNGGSNASSQGTRGGGAGIYLPSGSTLYILGEGYVKATGGAGQSGSNGGNGSGSSVSDKKFTLGAGGNGGAGGGGGGAGIGTNGGTGGSGAGSGGSQVSNVSGDNGANGHSGSAGAAGNAATNSMGSLIISQDMNGHVTATGGAAGTNANTHGGSRGSDATTDWSDFYRQGAGGAGGGAGGAGYAGKGIGAGGAGGGQGGGGGSAGYIWSRYYVGGGGGGGGVGAVYGAGGEAGNDSSKDWKDESRDSGRTQGATNGSSTNGSGGTGAEAYIYNKKKDELTTGVAGDGGSGGGAGSSGSSRSASYSNVTYNITYANVSNAQLSNHLSSYIAGKDTSITLPTYTSTAANADEVNFLGWQLTTYAKSNKSSSELTQATANLGRLYAPGTSFTIDSSTFGNIVFTAVVESIGGISDDDGLVYNVPAAIPPVVYHTYKVQVKVNGSVDKARGPIKIGEQTVTADVNGLYTWVTSSTGNKAVTIDGTNVGTAAADGATCVVDYETIKVKVAGMKPSMVELIGDAAPSLTDEASDNSPYVYSIERLKRDGESGPFDIYVDGEDTNFDISFTQEKTITYHTVTVNVTPHGKTTDDIAFVELRADDGENIYLVDKGDSGSRAVFAISMLRSKSYSLYVNGEDTGITTDFNADRTINYDYNRYTTTVRTYVDGVITDVGTAILGEENMVRTGVGSFTLTLTDNATRALNVDGAVVASSVTPGATKDINYYTITYVKSGDEQGKLPVDTNIYLSGSSATLLGGDDLTYGGKTYAGWRIDSTRYLAGGSVTVNKKINAVADWDPTNLAAVNATVTVGDYYFEYNAESQIPPITVQRGDMTLVEGVDYVLTFNNPNTSMGRGSGNTINAGEITVNVNGIGDYAGTLTTTYKILTAQLIAEGITTVERAYNGQKQVELSFENLNLMGVMEGDEGKVTLNTSSVAILDTSEAGENRVVTVGAGNLTGNAASNYHLRPFDPITVTITKRELDASMFTLSTYSVVYNGYEREPVVTASDVVNGENLISNKDFDVSYSNNVHAGQASVIITPSENSNYKSQENIVLHFDITKAPITISAKPASSVYGEEIKDVSGYVEVTSGTVFTTEDEADLAIEGYTTVAKGYGAKVYAGAVKPRYNVANSDYNVSLVNADYTITKASADSYAVSATGYVGIYDGNPHNIDVRVTGGDGTFTVYYGLTALNDSNYKTAGYSDPDAIAANVSRTNATGDSGVPVYFYVDNDNYVGTAGSRNVVITPSYVEVPGDEIADIEYGTDTALAKDNNGNFKDVGTYYVTYDPVTSADGNTITQKTPSSYAITPRKVHFTWPSVDPDTGKFTYEYNGFMQGVTATIDNAIAGDDVYVSSYVSDTTAPEATSEESRAYRNAESAAGFYIAKVSSIAGADAGNYMIDFTDPENNLGFMWNIEGNSAATDTRTPVFVEWSGFTNGSNQTPYTGHEQSVGVKRFYIVEGGVEKEILGLEPVYGGTYKATEACNWLEQVLVPYRAEIVGIIGAKSDEYRLAIEGDENFSSYDSTYRYSWSIVQADNSWISAPSIADWYYGNEASKPTGTSRFGDVVFKYQPVREGIADWTIFNWPTEDVPTQPGQYRLMATVAGVNDYKKLELAEPLIFNILPAEVSVIVDDKTSVYGDDKAELTHRPLTVLKGTLSEQELGALNISLTSDALASGAGVGTYPINASLGTASTIATLVPTSGIYTITNAEMTFTSGDTQVVYDGEPHSLQPSVTGAGGAEIDGAVIYYSTSLLDASNYASGSKTSPGYINVGEYPVYYYIVAPNYAPYAGLLTLKITKKEVTVDFEDEVTYGDTNWFNKYSSYGVGVHSITKADSDDGNIITHYSPATLTVRPRDITNVSFTIPSEERIYDGTAKEPVVTISDVVSESSLAGLDDFDIVYSDNVNAGDNTAKITITPKSGSNYTGSRVFTFSISPRAVTLTANDAQSVYNAAIADLSYEVTSGSILEADLAGLIIKTVSPVKKGDVAGTYADAITVTYKPSSNYNITTVSGTYTITAAALSVTASGYEGIYDGREHGVNVTAKTGKLLTYADIYYGESTVDSTNYQSASTVAPKFKNVGTYTVYYYAVCTNYEPVAGSVTVEISKAPLIVKPSDESMVYGQDVNSKLASISADRTNLIAVSGLMGTDTIETAIRQNSSITYTTNYVTGADVGNYTLSVAGAESDNYEISYAPGVLTVNPKPVTFTWTPTGDIVTVDGYPCYDYDGKSHGFVATAVGVLEGDGPITVVSSNAAITAANAEGEHYTARATGLVGNKDYNYCIAEDEVTASKDWRIRKAQNEWVIQPEFLTATGINDGDYSYEAAAKFGNVLVKDISYDTEVRTYTLTLYVPGTNNYDALEKTITYARPPKEVKPTHTDEAGNEISNINLTYGEPLPAPLNDSSLYTTDYEEKSPVGKKYTVIRKADDDNVYTPCTITLVKRPVELTWSDTTFEFDGTKKSVTAVANAAGDVAGHGVLEGDSVVVLAYSGNTGTNAGNYEALAATFGGIGYENYVVADGSHNWTITKAAPESGNANAITKNLSMTGWTYGSDPVQPYAEAKYGTVQYKYYRDEECTIPVTVADGAVATGMVPARVGTYYVKAYVDGNSNYDEIYQVAQFTITPAKVTIIAEDVSSPYGTAIRELGIDSDYVKVVGNVLEGDDLGLGISAAVTASSGVGEYPITLTKGGAGAVNDDCYDVTLINGTYFITAGDFNLSVTESGYQGVYDGDYHGISVAVTQSDGSAAEGVEIYYATTELTSANFRSGIKTSPTYKDVGEYVVYYYIASDNYVARTGSQTIIITRKDVNISANTISLTYGDAFENAGTTYETGGFIGDDTPQSLALNPTYNTDYQQYDSVGTYTVTPVLADTTNYHFVTGDSSVIVEKKSLDVDWDDSSFNYDGTAKTEDASLVGIVRNDDVSLVLANNVKTATGSYVARATGLTGEDAGNYEITADTSQYQWEIGLGTNYFTEPLSMASWSYGDTPVEPIAESLYGDVQFLYSTSIKGEYTRTKPTQAGMYFVKAYVPATSNYPALTSYIMNFNIDKSKVTVTANDVFALEGKDLKPLTYNLVGNIAEGENITVRATTTATKNSPVGDYPITLTVNASDNYDVTIVDGVYHVMNLDFEVSVDSYNGYYDGNHHGIVVDIIRNEGATGPEPKVYYSTVELPENTDFANSDDAFTVSPDRKDVGSLTVYYYVVSGEHVISGSKQITIDKSSILVTAKDKTIIEGRELVFDGCIIDGLAEGEDERVLDGNLVYSCSYSNGDPVGTYSIMPSGYASNNYEISYAPGTLTVLAQPIEVVINTELEENATYDGEPHKGILSASFAGASESDTLVYTYYDNAGHELPGPPTEAGTYKVKVEISEDNLLYHGSKEIEFTIAKRAVTAYVVNHVIYEGKEFKNFHVDYSGFLGDDATSLFNNEPEVSVYDSEGEKLTSLTNMRKGTYTLKAEGGSLTAVAAKNYELQTNDGRLEVIRIVNGEDDQEDPDNAGVIMGGKIRLFDDVDAGIVETAVIKEDTAPRAELEANLTIDKAAELLTDEEKEAIRNGSNALIYLLWAKVDDDNINVGEADAIKEKALTISDDIDTSNILFVDASLYKVIDDHEPTKISETGNTTVTIAVALPDGLINNNPGIRRTYYVVYYHNGEAKILDADFGGGVLSFEASEFSLYAIMYVDEVIAPTPGSGGDSNDSSNNTYNQDKSEEDNQDAANNNTPIVVKTPENNIPVLAPEPVEKTDIVIPVQTDDEEEPEEPVLYVASAKEDKEEKAPIKDKEPETNNLPKAVIVGEVVKEKKAQIKEAIEVINKMVPEVNVGPYVQIEDYDGDEEAITFTLPVPDDLNTEGRSFYLMTVKEDGTVVILTNESIVDGQLTFTGDPNATYQLIYEDGDYISGFINGYGEAVADDGNLIKVKTNHCYWHWLILILAALGAVFTLIFRKKKKLCRVVDTVDALAMLMICVLLGFCKWDVLMTVISIAVLLATLIIAGKSDGEDKKEDSKA